MFDVAIIGAGVVGALTARELILRVLPRVFLSTRAQKRAKFLPLLSMF